MNDGIANEKDLINSINNKHYSELNSNLQKFVSFIFQNINKNDIFIANKPEGGQVKTDIEISHNRTTKNVSIKKGGGNSVHQEKISVFFPFIEKSFGTIMLNNLKYFHYGDGTIDDSGIKRFDAKECKTVYKNEIKILNQAFNTPENIKIFFDRFLFTGNLPNSKLVDYVYHGSLQNGVWASREEIVEYFINNPIISDTLHFGPLTYQVWGRNNDFKAIHPDRRYVMQVKWGSVANDLLKIRSNGNG